VDGVGVFVPAEHAHCGDAVEVDGAQRGQGLVPVDVAVADFVVLVHPGVHPGGVDDVPVADVGPVVVAVGHLDVGPLWSGIRDHGAHIADAVGQVKGVRDADAVVDPRPAGGSSPSERAQLRGPYPSQVGPFC